MQSDRTYTQKNGRMINEKTRFPQNDFILKQFKITMTLLLFRVILRVRVENYKTVSMELKFFRFL